MATSDPWRPIRVSAWTWLEDVDPLAQRLWFWLATGPDSTQTGLVLLREYRACGALRTNPKALRAAVRELANVGRLSVGETRGSAVPMYLRGWWAAQCGRKSGDHPPMRAECAGFVDASLGAQACEEFDLWVSGSHQPTRQAGSRLVAASIQQEQKQDQEQKQEIKRPSVSVPTAPTAPIANVTDDKPKALRSVAFKPPTWEEADVYLETLRLPEGQTDEFMDYYTGNGWKVGRNPMKDWKATARRWARVFVEKGGRLEPMPQPTPDLFHAPKPATQTCPVCNRQQPASLHLSEAMGCPDCEGVAP